MVPSSTPSISSLPNAVIIHESQTSITPNSIQNDPNKTQSHRSCPESEITTGTRVLPCSLPTCSIAATTSIPDTTFPKTTCLPSNQGVSAVQRKNCDFIHSYKGLEVRCAFPVTDKYENSKSPVIHSYLYQHLPCSVSLYDGMVIVKHKRVKIIAMKAAKRTWSRMLQCEIFICELLPVN